MMPQVNHTMDPGNCVDDTQAILCIFNIVLKQTVLPVDVA